MSGQKKYSFLVDLREGVRAGLFYSVVFRISPFKDQARVFNISYYDSFLIVLLKKIAGVAVHNKKQSFYYNDILFSALHIKKGLLHYLLILLGLNSFAVKINAKNIAPKIDGKVISAHWGLTAGILSSHIAKVLKIKNVITFHGSDIHSIPEDRKNLVRATLVAMRNSTFNIFVSNDLYQKAKKLGYSGDNFKVIYNGIPKPVKSTEEDIQSFCNAKHIPKNKKIITFIGNFTNVKNLTVLPMVELYLQSMIEDYIFVFAGEGKLFEYLNTKMKNKIFLGHIDSCDVNKLLLKTDVLILPSLNEGLPLIIAEALALGVPPVTSDAGGIKEILPKDFIVPLGDDFEKRFAEKIYEKLCNNICPNLSDEFNIDYMQSKERFLLESL
ncbi:glycosyltransferase [Pseudoalteromonas sp. RB2-MNA-CIBAN-0110]|uniref:glycosyltransferase n=1 Tax=Pseudoalteromonas sp. RB2-MNA-CIBAN-0110 TaxID=3140439 RepID=UPI0033274238